MPSLGGHSTKLGIFPRYAAFIRYSSERVCPNSTQGNAKAKHTASANRASRMPSGGHKPRRVFFLEAPMTFPYLRAPRLSRRTTPLPRLFVQRARHTPLQRPIRHLA